MWKPLIVQWPSSNVCATSHRVLSLPAASSAVPEVEGGRDDDGDAQGNGQDPDGHAQDDQVGPVKRRARGTYIITQEGIHSCSK